jgi:SHS2 domain-containing protein
MYRWVDHTSELELHLQSTTRVGIFSEALAAIGELLAGDEEGDDPGEEETVPERTTEASAEADDGPALLAAWIEELVHLAESRSVIPLSTDQIDVDEGSVRATVRLRRGEPRPLVKAVTYHRLTLEQGPGGWEGRVVLDV